MSDEFAETPGRGGGRAETASRMRVIAAGLQAGGLDARVHEIRGVLDIRATLRNGGGKGTDVTLDEDGYVQICYWNDPGATPAQVIAVISRLLAAITRPS
jgi:hypothetical protein